MRAVDTNILARYYLADDKSQALVARRVLESGDVFIPKTVMLELAWVLGAVVEQPASKVLDCLRHLAELPGVTIEDAEEVHAAFDLCASGLEFADALHLSASSACTQLLTFDDRFVRRAARVRLKTRVVLPAAGPAGPRGVAQKPRRYRVSKRRQPPVR